MVLSRMIPSLSHGAWSPWAVQRWLVKNDPILCRADIARCVHSRIAWIAQCATKLAPSNAISTSGPTQKHHTSGSHPCGKAAIACAITAVQAQNYISRLCTSPLGTNPPPTAQPMANWSKTHAKRVDNMLYMAWVVFRLRPDTNHPPLTFWALGGQVGGWWGVLGGSGPRVPKRYTSVPQNDPLVALIIVNTHMWGF